MIVGPLVFKIIFDSFFEKDFHFLVIVELSNCAEELYKLFTLVSWVVVGVNAVKYFHEAAHTIGEDGYTKQKYKGTNKAFNLILWMVVTETNG